MKNIHKIGNELFITSDEEIKEGDWFISIPRETIHKCTGIFENNLIDNTWENREKVEITKADCKKIILTTDQDLIADEIQSIDDELLEWLVKNPSREFVEINILQGEPKQETLEEAADNWVRQPVIGTRRESFIAGAEWKAKRMYSEKEVLEMLIKCPHGYSDVRVVWFEKFKKK